MCRVFLGGKYWGFTVSHHLQNDYEVPKHANCTSWCQYPRRAAKVKTLQETNQNEEDTPVRVSNDATNTAPVAIFPYTSVDDVNLAVLEDNYGTTITDNSTYAPGMSIFITN